MTLDFKPKLPDEFKHVRLVGVELEGGWSTERGIAPYPDGSVRVSGMSASGPVSLHDFTEDENGREWCERHESYDCHAVMCACNTCTAERLRALRNRPTSERILGGEFCSQPLLPENIPQWVVDNYPDVSNESCGMHVHISTKSVLDYSRLMEKTFWNTFRTEYEAWARKNVRAKVFWNRWNGKNNFCLPTFNPRLQVTARTKGEGQRYAALNFAYCVRDRSTGVARETIELRVLPMFKSSRLAVRAICKYLTLVEEFLEKPYASKKIKADLPKQGELMDRVIECA